APGNGQGTEKCFLVPAEKVRSLNSESHPGSQKAKPGLRSLLRNSSFFWKGQLDLVHPDALAGKRAAHQHWHYPSERHLAPWGGTHDGAVSRVRGAGTPGDRGTSAKRHDCGHEFLRVIH